MGMIRQFRCPSCRAAWELHTGHGMRHGVLGRVMEAFSEEIREEIAKEARGGHLPLFRFDYRAAVCRQCRMVTAVPVLSLMEREKSYVGGCPRCGAQAEILDEDRPVRCPECQKEDLEMKVTGHWD